MQNGELRYQFEAPNHEKGGDPSGAFVAIDTGGDVLRVKPAGTGLVRAITLADLPAAIEEWSGNE